MFHITYILHVVYTHIARHTHALSCLNVLQHRKLRQFYVFPSPKNAASLMIYFNGVYRENFDYLITSGSRKSGCIIRSSAGTGESTSFWFFQNRKNFLRKSFTHVFISRPMFTKEVHILYMCCVKYKTRMPPPRVTYRIRSRTGCSDIRYKIYIILFVPALRDRFTAESHACDGCAAVSFQNFFFIIIIRAKSGV